MYNKVDKKMIQFKCTKRKAIFYKDNKGKELVKEWLMKLKKKKKLVEYSKLIACIRRAEQGNFGNYRFLAGNFVELKVSIGPGYRIYIGIDGDELIILLFGGTKETQKNDIDKAKTYWNEYKRSKNKTS